MFEEHANIGTYFQSNPFCEEIFSDECFTFQLHVVNSLQFWKGFVSQNPVNFMERFFVVFQETVLSLLAEVRPNKICDFLSKKKLLFHLEMDGLCKALTFSLTATNGLLFMICFYKPFNVASQIIDSNLFVKIIIKQNCFKCQMWINGKQKLMREVSCS